jgi:hypothetical protein
MKCWPGGTARLVSGWQKARMSPALLPRPIPNNLARKLRILIPELLELNGVPADRTAKFHVRYEHEESDVLAS